MSMNKRVDTSSIPKPTATLDGAAPVAAETTLERQMAACDLSPDTRRFLRNVHQAEKQLNSAYSTTRQADTLSLRVSRVYRELYGEGDEMPASAPDLRVRAADGRK